MTLKEKLDEAKIRQEAYFQGKQDAESDLLPKIERLSSEVKDITACIEGIQRECQEKQPDIDTIKSLAKVAKDRVSEEQQETKPYERSGWSDDLDDAP